MALNRPPAGTIASPDLNALAIHQTWDGRTEATSEFTLTAAGTAAVTSTTITNLAVKTGDHVFVNPLTANAKVAFLSTAFLVADSTADDAFVVLHPSSTQADRTFAYHFHGK